MNAITKVLGEANEKRLKDAITDLLIEQFKDDLANMSNYLIDWEEFFDEIINEIKDEFRKKVREKYLKVAEKNHPKYLKKHKEEMRWFDGCKLHNVY